MEHVTYGSLLTVLFFVEHVHIRPQRFYFQKLNITENFQLDLTDLLKMSPLKRKYSICKSVFLAHFAKKKF